MSRARKPVSIRTLMRNLCMAMIITILVLCGGLTIIKTQMIEQLQVSTDEITSLNQYIGSLSLLRGYASDYASALTPAARQNSEILMHRLGEQAAAITLSPDRTAFDAAIEDVDHYIETVTQLMNEQDNAMDFASYYNHSEQIWRSLQPRLFGILNTSIDRYEEISQRVFRQNITSLWTIILTVFLVSLVLVRYSSHVINRVARPLQSLTNQSLHIAGGSYEPVNLSQVASCQETEVLAQAFNMMVSKIEEQVAKLHDRIEAEERIHALEMENASIQIALSETERRLLQSMINPHFLFNCLSTISSMAYLEDAEKTVAMTGQISSYLHESLRSIGQEISLEAEIDFIQRYVSIQKMRFGERMRLVVDCAAGSRALIVPAMFLQPLVENAISHGLSSRVSGGTVWITAREMGEATEILIEDDGVGMGEEQLAQLNAYLRNNPPPGKGNVSGIGLTSTVRQIKNRFGERASLTLASRSGGGASILLHCPHV